MRRPGTDWMRGWPMARCGYASKATKLRDALVEAASSAPARASLLLPRRVNAARGMLGAKETAMLDKSYPYYIAGKAIAANTRSEEHTSELQSLMRISYAVFCLQKK